MKNFTLKKTKIIIFTKFSNKRYRTVSLPRNLKCCDRLSMSNGTEARVPFLDHKLQIICLI